MHEPEPSSGAEVVVPLPGSAVELLPDVRSQLLDPALWHESLERYVLATKLAVTLTDEEGRRLGECLNTRPTWSLLDTHGPPRNGVCPFSLMSTRPCSCIADALDRGRY